MSDLLSGQISFSGLGSGTDFGSIVTQLKQVESIPYMQMEAKRDTYEARIEAMDDIIKAMEEARDVLSKLSSRDNFVKKELSFGDDSFISGKATGSASDANYRIVVSQIAERSSIVNNANAYDGKDAKLGTDGTFIYEIQTGFETVPPSTTPVPKFEKREIKVTADMTLEQLENTVNNASDNPGIKMIVKESSSGEVSIGFTSEKTGANQIINILDDPALGNNIFGLNFSESSKGSDSAYEIDGFKGTSSTNDIEVAEGVTVNVFDVGTSTISVKTDTDEVKKNIQEFLDAINSVIKEMDSHTNIDAEADEVKQDDALSSVNDPNEDVISSYLEDLVSKAPTVKGNVLTGEYGISALDSRITNILTSLSPGFTRKSSADDQSGDLIGTLAEMGIKINASEGSPSYGLFEIAPDSGSNSTRVAQEDQARFDKYLDENLEDVINFFVADEEMKTSSTGFFYDSHIAGRSEPGVYDVKYNIDSSGLIVEGSVFINGEKAEGSGRTYTAVAGGASGIAIQISETAQGEYNETLKVQQGKIGEVFDMLDEEIAPYSPITLNESGAVSILRNSFVEAMESLDDQLWKEEARLDTWENRKKMEFARLETLLSRYNGISETLASQLGGLA